MHISKLSIRNFRGFEKKEIFLNSSFTVVIGDNGTGKSSLLHALQVALGAYLQCLPLLASPLYRRQFKSQEKFVKWSADEMDYVASKEETSIKVVAHFFADKQPVEWSRVMLANGTTGHKASYSSPPPHYLHQLPKIGHNIIPHPVPLNPLIDLLKEFSCTLDSCSLNSSQLHARHYRTKTG